MNIPGFTAEGSLYTSRAQYNMTATRFLAAKADIQPQLPAVCGYLSGVIRFKFAKVGEAASANDWARVESLMNEIQFFQATYAGACR
jgi:hypothetical protein